MKKPKEFGWYDSEDFPSLKGMNVWLMSGETQQDREPYLIVVTDTDSNDWETGLQISIENENLVLSESNQSKLNPSQEIAIRSWIRAYRSHLLKLWKGKMTGFEFCDIAGI